MNPAELEEKYQQAVGLFESGDHIKTLMMLETLDQHLPNCAGQ